MQDIEQAEDVALQKKMIADRLKELLSEFYRLYKPGQVADDRNYAELEKVAKEGVLAANEGIRLSVISDDDINLREMQKGCAYFMQQLTVCGEMAKEQKKDKRM